MFNIFPGATNGAMDAGNLLKPMLGRGELRCIGATTLDEYRKYIEKDPALERRFQQVYVDQPTVPDTISILRGLRERYELHHGVRISDSALVEAAVLSDRYISDRFLPDKGKLNSRYKVIKWFLCLNFHEYEHEQWLSLKHSSCIHTESKEM